jgi:hypothetical protein
MRTVLVVVAVLAIVAIPVMANESDKAEKLSQASGLPVDKILEMRNGGTQIIWVDSDGDGLYDDMMVVQGQPMGWGELAQALGLHPSVLGADKEEKGQARNRDKGEKGNKAK